VEAERGRERRGGRRAGEGDRVDPAGGDRLAAVLGVDRRRPQPVGLDALDQGARSRQPLLERRARVGRRREQDAGGGADARRGERARAGRAPVAAKAATAWALVKTTQS
jgi:hypothetical protein